MHATLPTWIVAIAVIVVLQTTSAYLGRLVPIAAPAFTAEFGWDESWVGYLSAANVVGALFIAHRRHRHHASRMGGVLALQMGLLIGAASLLLYLVPSIALALLASICVGLSNGTANPAGSEVLSASRRRRTATSCSRSSRPACRSAASSAACHSAADRGAGLADARWSSSPSARIAASLLTLPFRSRIDPPREQRMQQRGWSASG